MGEQIGAWPLRRSLPWSLPLGVIGAAEEEDTARATLDSDGGVCCMEMEEVPRLALVYKLVLDARYRARAGKRCVTFYLVDVISAVYICVFKLVVVPTIIISW